jgi:hypothetical protein
VGWRRGVKMGAARAAHSSARCLFLKEQPSRFFGLREARASFFAVPFTPPL